jgi:periplasmic divalent cation tolerance protein
MKIILTTISPIDARDFARSMIRERMAACVNILPAGTSLYEWQGAIEEESESVLIIKTSAKVHQAAVRWIGENHPYDVPEIVTIEEVSASQDYLKWLKDYVEKS